MHCRCRRLLATGFARLLTGYQRIVARKEEIARHFNLVRLKRIVWNVLVNGLARRREQPAEWIADLADRASALCEMPPFEIEYI
jgi:hypothetical protein